MSEEELWQFKSDSLTKPDGIAVDTNHNVVVLGFESIKLILTQNDGKESKTLLTESDSLNAPSAVYYDKGKRILLICNQDGTDQFNNTIDSQNYMYDPTINRLTRPNDRIRKRTKKERKQKRKQIRRKNHTENKRMNYKRTNLTIPLTVRNMTKQSIDLQGEMIEYVKELKRNGNQNGGKLDVKNIPETKG
ncbi:TRIM2_3 [Mytilus edulis]|uniref:TRIM2_3 n=1 Tax=Mytilus edulis TaxID=6550 RepID=A0A8S3SNU9_MYTED|nr:TRIM2_3 [Mytilus edulis]